MRTILVTGGAGYIGSHIVEQLVARGDRVIILDALIYGQSWPILAQPTLVQPTLTGSVQESASAQPVLQGTTLAQPTPVQSGSVTCIQGQCGDVALLDTIFSKQTIDAVIHCAAFIEVGISVKEPLAFYATNVVETLVLLDCMKAHGVNKIVFSSSAAVYGNPGVDCITENAPCMPLNPYGQSKLFIERVLADCAHAYWLRYAALRYFNVAGAYPEKGLGERHDPETHVVPLLLRAAMENKLFNLYSADYGTADGTCIRDYVHVRDIARANVLACDALLEGVVHESAACESVTRKSVDSFVVNIGSGRGVSVLDLVHQVETVVQKTIVTQVVERRSGDAATLVADAARAQQLLGWCSHYTLNEMLSSAYEFHSFCGVRQQEALSSGRSSDLLSANRG